MSIYIWGVSEIIGGIFDDAVVYHSAVYMMTQAMQTQYKEPEGRAGNISKFY